MPKLETSFQYDFGGTEMRLTVSSPSSASLRITSGGIQLRWHSLVRGAMDQCLYPGFSGELDSPEI